MNIKYFFLPMGHDAKGILHYPSGATKPVVEDSLVMAYSSLGVGLQQPCP